MALITSSPAQRRRISAILEALALDPRHVDRVEESYQSSDVHGLREGGVIPEYHGPKHCIWVANAFIDLASGILTEDKLRHGLVAALWHDAQHPMAEDDDVNTSVSADAYACAADPRVASPAHALIDAGIDIDRVAALVRATSTREGTAHQAPPGDENVLSFLRDADLLQTVVGPAAQRQKWTDRLRSELGERFASDGSELSNYRYVEARLTTAAAKSALRRFAPQGA